MVGSCECGNEHSDKTEVEKFYRLNGDYRFSLKLVLCRIPGFLLLYYENVYVIIPR